MSAHPPRVAADLATRAITAGDVDAAIVVGDLQQERGLASIRTGRVRSAPFLLDSGGGQPAIFVEQGIRESGPFRFDVPVHEHVFGLDRFAAEPTALRWSGIYIRYDTGPAQIYGALARAELVPIRIADHMTPRRFKDLEWRAVRLADRSLRAITWDLFDTRTLTRAGQPIYVGSISRSDISGPRATHEWSLSGVAPSRRLPVVGV